MRVVDLFHASFHPGTGPRTEGYNGVVGDGLVPSRCQVSRRVRRGRPQGSPLRGFVNLFNGLRICTMEGDAPLLPRVEHLVERVGVPIHYGFVPRPPQPGIRSGTVYRLLPDP